MNKLAKLLIAGALAACSVSTFAQSVTCDSMGGWAYAAARDRDSGVPLAQTQAKLYAYRDLSQLEISWLKEFAAEAYRERSRGWPLDLIQINAVRRCQKTL